MATDQFGDATKSVRTRLRVLGLLPAVVLAALAALVNPLVGLVVLVVLAGAWLGWTQRIMAGAMDAAVQSSSPGFVEGGAAVEALNNAVEGVGVMIGVPAPQVRLISSESANAMVAASSGEATLVVTTALITGSGPAELEAVAAELLCRVRDGSAEFLTLCGAIPAWLKGLSGASDAAVQAALGDQRSARADLEAIAVTRYPPALISTLERMALSGTEVPGARPETAPLWLAPAIPGSEGRSEVLGTAIQPISYRAALLREL